MAATRARIIVLEDDADISKLLKLNLESAGFEVRSFASAHGLLSAATAEKPVLFLLDIMVPGGSGFDICKAIRQSAVLQDVPVIFLTAKSSEQDKVTGLELGADDYITKPFGARELVARIKAVLRRFEQPLHPQIIHAGELSIDPAAMHVTMRGEAVQLTATEFRLLEFLARNAGRVYTRDQILDAVWRETQFVTPRSVDVYVLKLREKIELDPSDPRYLRTVRGAGYRFEAPK
jgi:DNA-binding response OmpR family regulator